MMSKIFRTLLLFLMVFALGFCETGEEDVPNLEGASSFDEEEIYKFPIVPNTHLLDIAFPRYDSVLHQENQPEFILDNAFLKSREELEVEVSRQVLFVSSAKMVIYDHELVNPQDVIGFVLLDSGDVPESGLNLDDDVSSSEYMMKVSLADFWQYNSSYKNAAKLQISTPGRYHVASWAYNQWGDIIYSSWQPDFWLRLEAP